MHKGHFFKKPSPKDFFVCIFEKLKVSTFKPCLPFLLHFFLIFMMLRSRCAIMYLWNEVIVFHKGIRRSMSAPMTIAVWSNTFTRVQEQDIK